MKVLTTFLLALTYCLPLLASPPEEAEIEDLAWMAGLWRASVGTATIDEGWLGPDGGSMLGVNRTIVSGRTVAFEFLRLEEREQGVVLLASPEGRCPATPFRLIEIEENRAVFSNPEHDFPQHVVYERVGDRLNASIEGVEDGEPTTVGWVFVLQP